MRRESAETVAVEALAWIASDDDVLSEFMGATGSDPADIRQRAGDAEFLGAVLDFLLMQDRWIEGFCDRNGYAYDVPGRARAVLPGGDLPHWT
ncbi:hypothetical protein OCGS_0794 [Oceaniovalibus guishaninsula JLT2003]|uniref:DUF3572 domain-containing protein n=1 Tax=Oceaniovalibus guishaninsula JLT2003 TaxID=1231392 RepID=K2HQQ3_9RHOB|nr:DUF3572 domain-containing protein [Oceaniovalibus guishaninsula]EKE45099.1 hypothetical protein OCGS_0794 [Oceaniovalibus guishaninsula JLT2003]